MGCFRRTAGKREMFGKMMFLRKNDGEI